MASIGNDSNGRKRILFAAGDGKRKTIRLGRASAKQANSFRLKVEALIGGGITGHLDDEVSRWIAGLNQTMHGRLAAVGLLRPRLSTRLGAFIDDYITVRCDVKPGTTVVYSQTKRNLVNHFGTDKELREITTGDADAWRTVHLIGKEKLSDNTVRRRCGIAKQFFKTAVRKNLIASNPFADLKAATLENRKRDRFISRSDMEKVITACPDAQWRAIFILARYGGLRCPTEILALRWEDIDWAAGRITIHSAKTEHHEGKEERVIPLFPELRPVLLELFEAAELRAVHVITRYQLKNKNLRTQSGKIIKRAGLKLWPKPFQNLRSTRETELADVVPEHVVCKWIGNSKVVARAHYLQVTDEHFDRAVEGAAQNPAQSGADKSGQTRTLNSRDAQKTLVCPSKSDTVYPSPFGQVGDTGFEPVTSTL